MNLILGVSLFFVASLFLSKVTLDIINRKISTLSFVYIIFYIFYIIPMLVDYTFPNIFYKLYNYTDSFYNESTIFFSIVINFIIVLYFIFSYKTIKMTVSFDVKNIIIKKIMRLAVLFLIVLILILVIRSPNPIIYLDYGAVIADYNPILREYHAMLAMFCRLLIFFAAIDFLFINKNKYGYIFYFLIAFFACWLGGKRSFVAYSLLIFVLSLFFSSKISPKRILPTLIAVVIFFISFTSFYQNNVRDFDDKSSVEKMENILIDYSRLQNERYVIFNLLNGRENILPYSGASFLYSLTFYIPRSVWADKPYPYAVYYTNHFFGIDDVNDRLGWGLTTGLLDESIANFYWFGIIFYLSLIHCMVRYNDRNMNSFSGLLGIVVACLMIIIHFAAFSYIFVFWVFVNIISRKKRNSIRKLM